MRWPVQVVAATGSTNADLVAAARAGDAGPRVLAARRQDAGRGRLDRSWASPDSASLAVSWLWRPGRAQQDWPWLPMVVGLGVLDAAAALGVPAGLKWPNDVVVPVPAVGRRDGGATHGLRKLAGILVEVAAGPDGRACAVAGVGLNVGLGERDLPVPTATSVLVETGRDPGFDAALEAVLAGVGQRLTRWSAAEGGRAGDPPADRALRADYRAACTTLGRMVHVTTPGGAVRGTAVDVDDAGCLVVRVGGTAEGAAGRDVRVSAGDVEHVR